MIALKLATKEQSNALTSLAYGEGSSLIDYTFNNFDTYVTADGYAFEVEKYNKISINKVMWYDDEMDTPDNNLINFLKNNRTNSNKIDVLTNSNSRIALARNNGTYVDIVKVSSLYNGVNDNDFIRLTTPDEIADIMEIYSNQKAKYEARLIKYFNRYGDKISMRGYWANR